MRIIWAKEVLGLILLNHMAMVTSPPLKKPTKHNKTQPCIGTFGKILLVTSSTLEYAVQRIWLKYT